MDKVETGTEDQQERKSEQQNVGLLQQVMKEIECVLRHHADHLTTALADHIKALDKKKPNSAFLHSVGREGLMMKGLRSIGLDLTVCKTLLYMYVYSCIIQAKYKKTHMPLTISTTAGQAQKSSTDIDKIIYRYSFGGPHLPALQS